jgi:hypothetical protein
LNLGALKKAAAKNTRDTMMKNPDRVMLSSYGTLAMAKKGEWSLIRRTFRAPPEF